jgi:hypothetical protein
MRYRGRWHAANGRLRYISSDSLIIPNRIINSARKILMVANEIFRYHVWRPARKSESLVLR